MEAGNAPSKRESANLMNASQLKRFVLSSPKKKFNLLKVYASYYLDKPDICTMPIRLMIEPANFCNLACPTCPVGNGSITKAKTLMDFENFKKVIDEAAPYLYHLTLWNWGEPFLNQQLADCIKYARKKGVYVATSTNGHFFTDDTIAKILDSDLNELIVALDGLSQETLSKYRINSNFEQIVAGVKKLTEAKKKSGKQNPVIELQFIVMKHNEQEIEKVEKFAKDLGFDRLVIKTFGSQLDVSRIAEFEPADKRFSRYDKQPKKDRSCFNIWRAFNINCDGNSVPCCYDPFETQSFGNAFQSGVKAIWQGEKFVRFRQAVLNGKDQIGICKNCDYNKNISEKITLNK